MAKDKFFYYMQRDLKTQEEIREEMGYRRGYDQGFYVAWNIMKDGQTPAEAKSLSHILHYFWRCGLGCKDIIFPPVEVTPEQNRTLLKKWKRRLDNLAKIWNLKY